MKKENTNYALQPPKGCTPGFHPSLLVLSVSDKWHIGLLLPQDIIPTSLHIVLTLFPSVYPYTSTHRALSRG